jgi:hypothetical protein
VSVYINAAYGIHHDLKSHTGSCVVIGDVGAVHCRSSKQQIIPKSSTEAKLVALSDCANQALYIRNFLMEQGYPCGPVTVYQERQVRSGTNEAHRHQILLAEGKSEQRRGCSESYGHRGHVCQHAHEAATRTAIRE